MDPYSLDAWNGEPCVVIFIVALPTALSLPHGTTVTYERDEVVDWLRGLPQRIQDDAPWVAPGAVFSDERNIVSLKIWQHREKLRFPDFHEEGVSKVIRAVAGEPDLEPSAATEAAAEKSAPEGFATIIEAVTPLFMEPGQDKRAAMTKAFDRCVEEINSLQRAYILATKSVRVRLLSRETLSPVVPYVLRDPSASAWGRPDLFLINEGWNLPIPAELLTPEQTNQLLVTASRLRQGDPFAAAYEWVRVAEQAWRLDGNYVLAAVATYTSTEMLFDAVLLMLAWEEGAPRAETRTWFDENLSKRLRTHYGTRLGGNWDTFKAGTALEKWARTIGSLRHRVIHTGNRPTQREVREALEVATEVDDFVKGRVASARGRYPRTALLLLGTPGLSRLGVYSGKIKRFAEEAARMEQPWLPAYREWWSS